MSKNVELANDSFLLELVNKIENSNINKLVKVEFTQEEISLVNQVVLCACDNLFYYLQEDNLIKDREKFERYLDVVCSAQMKMTRQL